ncbi:hypothetical protein GGQ87_000490 [Brevundimonas alba]|uniref:Uncharacterized protein n=1 Tax=Brevundimonas alba TaxID=74314 RepID=A0A7X5YIK6_9CAUL|nr:hypothetical protein [Brevundimonas alba]NJC40232.1 hypothetical protein [Brevundimonas alba]
MSDTQSDNLYRNDNKALSSGSQSADLSRSGGTPVEQQTAPDASRPDPDQDSQGAVDAGGGSARAAPAPASGHERPTSDEGSGGGEGTAGGGASAPASSVAPGPVAAGEGDDGQSSARDGRIGGDLDHEGEMTLGGRADWTDHEGGQHSREGEITVGGSTDTSAGLEGAASRVTDGSAGLGDGLGDFTDGLRDPGEALDGALDRVDDALTSVTGVLGGAQAALTSAAGEVADLPAVSLAGVEDAVSELGAVDALTDSLPDVASSLPHDVTSGLAEQLPDLDPVISSGASNGFLAGLFDPAKAVVDAGSVGGGEDLTDAVSGLLGGSDDDGSDHSLTDDGLDLGL